MADEQLDTAAARALSATAEPTGKPADALAAEALEPGQAVGRYVILSMLGQGGMGVVYAAYDPELDRRVALKLLRTNRPGSEPSTEGRRRLLREAQALARLSHPNVIGVHDVGTIDEQVFVAMAFIDGQTLRSWLEEEERSLDEVLPVFIDAGRGLAAAHEAHLVHRDFKPENVLIDKDRQVYVMDFGLARPTSSESHRTPTKEVPAATLSGEQTVLGVSLTRTGSVVGTPAYMAPEQFLGEATDSRTDQFCFCIALYEALYGERPFAGGSLAELALAVTRGPVRDEPQGSSVPPSIRRTLLRGLKVDPEERHPSMDALLQDLTRILSGNKKRWAVAGGLAAVALLGALGARALVGEQDGMCRASSAKLIGIWDDATRGSVLDTFLASKRPYARDTFERVATIFDARTQDWVSMHTETCEATHIRGEQSEALLDLRMQCLDRRLLDLRAMTQLFTAERDGEIVDTAVQAALSLPTLDRCADAKALTAAIPPPEAPDLRARVEELQAQLDDVIALDRAGKYDRGLQALSPLVESASTVNYAPLQAELLATQAALQAHAGDAEAAEKSLHALLDAAATAQRHDLVAEAWTSLLSVVGHSQARHEEAIGWIPFARAAVAQAGNEPGLHSSFLRQVGVVLMADGKYEEAEPYLEEALAIREEHDGASHTNVAGALGSLARLYRSQGDFQRSKEHAERALKIMEEALGATHPEVATSLNNLAILEARLGDRPRARAYHERALSIREAALGPEHRLVAASLNNLGNISFGDGNYEQAEKEYSRALQIRIEVLGPEHPLVASPTNNLGSVLQSLGKTDEAIEMYQRAYEIRKESLGPEHPRTASPLRNLGFAYEAKKDYEKAREYFQKARAIYVAALGPEHALVGGLLTSLGSVSLAEKNFDEARATFERAIEIAETALGPDHVEVSDALNALGETYLQMGKPDAARPLLRRALAIRSNNAGDGTFVAQTRFALARSLWPNAAERAVARELARLARDAYRESGQGSAEELAEIEAWILSHGR